MALIILQFIGASTIGVGVVLGVRRLLKVTNPLKRYVKKIVIEYLEQISKG